jgi:hypothetical protein
MPFVPNSGYTLDTTYITTWFERDRMHVALYSQKDVLLVEWWDEAVGEAINDGFLKIKSVLEKVQDNGGPELHETALAYYKQYCYPRTRVTIKSE